MKIRIQKSGERGYAKISWLETHYTFSFAGYYNPDRMGFGALRVLNDDIIAPGGGFATHPHDNMEIVTIVTKGALKHQDTTGHNAIIHPNEVQAMSAGTGLMHSEINASSSEPLELFQLWIDPKERDIEPCYEERVFKDEQFHNMFTAVASGFDTDDAAYIHQDARICLGRLEEGLHQYTGRLENGIFIMVIDGTIHVGGNTLHKRDSAEIVGTQNINIEAIESSHVMVVEVPV